MSIFNILNKKKSVEVPREVEDWETKYNLLVNEINKVISDLLVSYSKDAYYLAYNRYVIDKGIEGDKEIEGAKLWADYYMGKVSVQAIELKRLLRIMGQDTAILEDIFLKEKQIAIEDIKRCENIMELLKVDEKKE